MKRSDCCVFCIVAVILAVQCYALPDVTAAVDKTEPDITNSISRLNHINSSTNIDASAMRAAIRGLAGEKDAHAVPVLLRAYYRDKETVQDLTGTVFVMPCLANGNRDIRTAFGMDSREAYLDSFLVTTSYEGIDQDEDTLPDLWEMQYFGNLDQTASGDYDSGSSRFIYFITCSFHFVTLGVDIDGGWRNLLRNIGLITGRKS